MSDAIQPRTWRFVGDLGALAREAQQLANHYSTLLRRLGDIDLKPDKETPTLFKWGGNRVYMKNFTGTMPSSGTTDVLMSGIDAPLLRIGWHNIKVVGTVVQNRYITDVEDDQVSVQVDSDGNLVFGGGSLFQDVPYDLTIFYTRRAA